MARYVGDQNVTGMLIESGTYAVTSGTALNWIGYIQSCDINEDTGVKAVRYQGNMNRNVGLWVDGPLNYTAKISYYPTDWSMLPYVLGSCVDVSGTSLSTHVITETNSASGNAFTSGTKMPFMSFTLVNQQKGAADGLAFNRTIGGCMVDSATISMKQGDMITVDLDVAGQSGTFTSGTPLVPAIDSGYTKPLMWQNIQVHMPSGTIVSDVLDATIKINNNLEKPHYLNGSRVIEAPQPLNRDYEVDMTLHATSEQSKGFYNQYFIGGSEFNMMFSVTENTGSRYAYFVFSGCKMTDMSAPTKFEGINEQKLSIKPKSLIINAGDLNAGYNPW